MKKILSVVIILIVIMLGTYIFNLQNDNEKENTNMSNEIEKNNERKNKVIEAYPNSIGLDLTNAYSEISKLLCELNLKIQL